MKAQNKIILIVLGTRPEVIKLAPVIAELKRSELSNNLLVVSTSQHEELLDEQLKSWNVEADLYLPGLPKPANLTRLLVHTISGLQDILEQYSSLRYVLVQGDTNTALASANFAFLNGLKLIHIEAGLRSFDYSNPFPEEFNRVVTSRAAYFHFAPTETSKNNLLKEGVDESRIRVVGNTGIDALNSANGKIDSTLEKNVVLITLHRRENIAGNLHRLIEIVQSLARNYSHLRFKWIAHPNNSENVKKAISGEINIEVIDPLPYSEFIALYRYSKMVITDSGGVSEEAVHLGLPIIIFRHTTERVEPIAKNYPMVISLDKHKIQEFFHTHINQVNRVSFSYGEGNASAQIVSWLQNEMRNSTYDVVILGAGPAGTGILLKALNDKNEHFFTKNKIAVVEKTNTLIKGSLCQYQINSDTQSDVFLECLKGDLWNANFDASFSQEVDKIRAYSGQSIPLQNLDSFYDKLGDQLKHLLVSRKKCDLLMESEATRIVQRHNGTFDIYLDNRIEAINATKLILTTGGKPREIPDYQLKFHEEIPLDIHVHKTLHSDILLKEGLPGHLKDKIEQLKVVILGGSHSGFSAAHFLLGQLKASKRTSNKLKIWSRNIPKIFFNDRKEAIESGYLDFTDADICPLTQKIYRLAGLRMDGRILYMRIAGIGNEPKEERVQFTVFTDQTFQLKQDLHEADLIINALGYTMNIVPFFKEDGGTMKFAGEITQHWVNDHCEVIDVEGNVIPNLFACGLATGFVPRGELGGEPSFNGQTNGIWYYQHAIAERIIQRIESQNEELTRELLKDKEDVF